MPKSLKIMRIKNNILEKVHEHLTSVLGRDSPFPEALKPRLKALLIHAYDWNSVAKQNNLEYRLTPFVPFPSAPFDPEKMQPFESSTAEPDEKIISLVAMGLTLSSGRENRGPAIEVSAEKAKVLVDGWLGDSPAGLKPTSLREVAIEPSNATSTGEPFATI